MEVKTSTRIVHYYSEYLEKESLIERLKREKFGVNTFYFFRRSNKKDKIFSKSRVVIEQFLCLFKIVLNLFKFRNESVFCFGGHYSFFVVTRLFGFLLGKDYHLYCYNFYLHDLSSNKFVHHFLKFFLKSKQITLIVQSPNEVKFYEKYAITPIHFIPFSCSMENLPDKADLKNGNYIFSGGYSNRDYQLLLESIRQNPEVNFVIVASALNRDICDIPSNVKVYKDTDNKQFNKLLMNALGVIVPLKKDVGASGQLVSLLAMQMHKPIIYCDISVINYYFISNKTGIPYQLGNLQSLNHAIQTLVKPGFDREKMAQESFKRCSENFTKEKRDTEFIKILKAATGVKASSISLVQFVSPKTVKTN